MAKPRDLKPQCKKLYIEDGWEIGDIAKSLRLNSRTLYDWAKKESWQAEREALLKKASKSPEILITALEGLLEKVESVTSMNVEGTEDLQDIAKTVSQIADSISKITKTIKSLYKDQDRLGSILFVLADIGKFITNYRKTSTLTEEFFESLDKLLGAYQSHAITTYSPGIKS